MKDKIKQFSQDPEVRYDLFHMFNEVLYGKDWLEHCDAIRNYVQEKDLSLDILVYLNEIQETRIDEFFEDFEKMAA